MNETDKLLLEEYKKAYLDGIVSPKIKIVIGNVSRTHGLSLYYTASRKVNGKKVLVTIRISDHATGRRREENEIHLRIGSGFRDYNEKAIGMLHRIMYTNKKNEGKIFKKDENEKIRSKGNAYH